MFVLEIELHFDKWKKAVEKFLIYPENKDFREDNKKTIATIQNSIPGAIYIVSSFAIIMVAEYLAKQA